MRIGFFTDTYFPVSNGICYVIDIIKKDLEAMGHEVYVVAPTNVLKKQPQEKNVIRIKALQGVLYSDQFFSFFRASHQFETIRKLELDVIVLFTPSLIGGLGIYSAKKLGIPYVIQYGTDMEAYAQKYKFTTLVGAVGAFIFEPYLARLGGSRTLKFYKSFFSKGQKGSLWQKTVRRVLTPMHEQAAVVIATSAKTAKQLKSWDIDQRVETIPTGVDALPASDRIAKKLKKDYGFSDDDQIVLYVGRMSIEKNLDILIDGFGLLARKNSKAKLLLVGDFQYRQQLEERAALTEHPDRIIFTGLIDRNILGSVYSLAKVFVFPSMTDCQALVLNEAAHAGLPLVWCDTPELNPILKDGVSGLQAKNSARDLANKINKILADKELAKKLGRQAKKISSNYSEAKQGKKVETLLNSIVHSTGLDV